MSIIRNSRQAGKDSAISSRGLIRLVGFLGLMGLVGCSSGDDPDKPENPNPKEELTVIRFSGGIEEKENLTRAGLEEVLTGEKSFTAYGYKNDGYDGGTDSYTSYQAVMPGFKVNWLLNSANSTAANTHDWEYLEQGPDQTIKYWDWSALAYRFFGYAKGNATADPATTPADVTVTGGTVANVPNDDAVTFSATVDASSDATINAAPYFSHLWFSTGNLALYPDKQFGQPVLLQFVKPFARVRFMFTFAEKLNFGREKLREPVFKPATAGQKIPTSGTITFSYPLKGTQTEESFAISGTAGIDQFDIDYYETPDPAVTPDNALPTTYPNTTGKWYYVLPVENQGDYSISVQVVTNEVRTSTIPARFMNWKPGYEYTYTFKITESGGIILDVIQVAINDWGNKHTSQHTVYNW